MRFDERLTKEIKVQIKRQKGIKTAAEIKKKKERTKKKGTKKFIRYQSVAFIPRAEATAEPNA